MDFYKLELPKIGRYALFLLCLSMGITCIQVTPTQAMSDSSTCRRSGRMYATSIFDDNIGETRIVILDL